RVQARLADALAHVVARVAPISTDAAGPDDSWTATVFVAVETVPEPVARFEAWVLPPLHRWRRWWGSVTATIVGGELSEPVASGGLVPVPLRRGRWTVPARLAVERSGQRYDWEGALGQALGMRAWRLVWERIEPRNASAMRAYPLAPGIGSARWRRVGID